MSASNPMHHDATAPVWELQIDPSTRRAHYARVYAPTRATRPRPWPFPVTLPAPGHAPDPKPPRPPAPNPATMPDAPF